MSTNRIARMEKEAAGAVATAGQDIRYVPHEGRLDFAGLAHETRYVWAVAHLRLERASVLDLGCGSGYGAFLLAEKAQRVRAIDTCAEAIALARKSYARPNLQYSCRNACAPDLVRELAPHTYDIIVSFDVIEHIERYFDYLENAARLLTENGRFVLSTPNRLQTFSWNARWNPYHIQEFTAYQLRSILGLYFAEVNLMTQDFRDSAKREAVRRGLKDRQALREADPLTRAWRKMWRHLRSVPRQTLDHSDILFSLEPGDEAFAQAFGLMAICDRPRSISPDHVPSARRTAP